jgi:hypothetical protein
MTVKAEGVTRLYFDNIYRLHSLPRALTGHSISQWLGSPLTHPYRDPRVWRPSKYSMGIYRGE